MREDSASEHTTVGAVTLVSALAFGQIRTPCNEQSDISVRGCEQEWDSSRRKDMNKTCCRYSFLDTVRPFLLLSGLESY